MAMGAWRGRDVGDECGRQPKQASIEVLGKWRDWIRGAMEGDKLAMWQPTRIAALCGRPSLPTQAAGDSSADRLPLLGWGVAGVRGRQRRPPRLRAVTCARGEDERAWDGEESVCGQWVGGCRPRCEAQS